MYDTDRATDEKHIAWAGDIAHLRMLSLDGWPDESVLLDTTAYEKYGLAIVPLHGIITRSVWIEASAELLRLSLSSNTAIVLTIDTTCQQEEGFSDFVYAIKKCNERGKVVTCHVERAYGFAVLVCHAVNHFYSLPEGLIGHVRVDLPFNPITDVSLHQNATELASEQLIAQLRKYPRSPSWEICRSLENRYVHAEQLERDMPKMVISPSFELSLQASHLLGKD